MTYKLFVKNLEETAKLRNAPYIKSLIDLGFNAEQFDDYNIKIKDYLLPCGWQSHYTDLLLQVPQNPDDCIHGIQIPLGLKHNPDKTLNVRTFNGGFVPNWILLSCYLSDSSLCDENLVRNHMDLVKRILSFRKCTE